MRGWGGDLLENLIHREEIGSTNDDLKKLIRFGEVWEGALVLAERQTSGRGRNGAAWTCEEGKGLTFSVLVRPHWPKERWGWVSLAAGLAVAEAMESLSFSPQIKWPNDLLLKDKKFCGILVEAMGDDVVVGIGLNVKGEEKSFPEGVEATTLEAVAGYECSREQALERVWRNLGQVMKRQPEEVAEAVWERLAWRDEEILLLNDGQGETGVIRAFGSNGELQVEVGGELRKVSDVSSVRKS